MFRAALREREHQPLGKLVSYRRPPMTDKGTNDGGPYRITAMVHGVDDQGKEMPKCHIVTVEAHQGEWPMVEDWLRHVFDADHVGCLELNHYFVKLK